MRLRAAAALAAACLAVPALVLADGKDAAKDKEKPAAGAPKVKRDPDGKKGISPYMEALQRGDAALVARDLAGAVSAYQDAVKLDATKMLAFARLAEALRESGKLDDAGSTLETALGKQGDDSLKAHVMFLLADLRERQKSYDAAKDLWTKYASFVEGKGFGYAASAKDRLAKIEEHAKLEKQYGEVRERIKKRQEEREKEARENAMKDTKNK